MTNNSVLITGGAGFIGTRLARIFHNKGYRVVVLDCLLKQVHGTNPKPDLPNCHRIWADVRDIDQYIDEIGSVDAVYHLAAETGVGQSQYEISRYVSCNTLGTAKVLEFAMKAKVKQVIIASSRAVYGEGLYYCQTCNKVQSITGRDHNSLVKGLWDYTCTQCGHSLNCLPMSEESPTHPTSIYGITKLQQEELALLVGKVHDISITVLRLFNVYGPGQSLSNPYVGVLGTFFRKASKGETINVYEDGKMMRDFVYVEDVANSFSICYQNSRVYNQILNVGTGRPVTLLDAALKIKEALKSSSPINISGQFRVGDIRHAVADIKKLSETLGYIPSTEFQQGLNDYIHWANNNYRDANDDEVDVYLEQYNLLKKPAEKQ